MLSSCPYVGVYAMTVYVLAGLVRRRAELDGEAIQLCKRLEQVSFDRSRLDAAILVFDAEMNLAHIRPVRCRAPNTAAKGHWLRTALDVLREAREALPTKEVVARVMDRVGADRENGPVRRMVTRRVGHALQYQRARGLLRSGKGAGQVVLWEVILRRLAGVPQKAW